MRIPPALLALIVAPGCIVPDVEEGAVEAMSQRLATMPAAIDFEKPGSELHWCRWGTAENTSIRTVTRAEAPEGAVTGKRALEWKIPPRDEKRPPVGLTVSAFPSRAWALWDYLEMDIYCTDAGEKSLLPLRVYIDGADSTGWADNYHNEGLGLRKGPNHIRLHVRGILRSEGDYYGYGAVDPRAVRCMHLFTGTKNGTTLYIDNVTWRKRSPVRVRFTQPKAGEGLVVSKEEIRGELTTLHVEAPGRLKVIMDSNAQEAGISGLFDLKNDPRCRFNYAAPFQGGLFTHKLTLSKRSDGKTGAIIPGPGKIGLIEANPVRAIMRHTWRGRNYGHGSALPIDEVLFEQTFCIAAPGKVFQTLAVIGTEGETKLKSFQYLLHTSHAKFAGGKTLHGGGYSLPGPWTFLPEPGGGPKAFILHVARPGKVTHGDGSVSTHRANFLQVMHKAASVYGYRSNTWIGFRSSLALPVGQQIKKGDRLEWHSVLHVGDDVPGSLGDIAPYVKEYREPGVPRCATGRVVGDGFDEATGSYTVEADGGVDLTLPVDCHWPVLEIAGWNGAPPQSIAVGGEPGRPGTGYVASVDGGRLLVQIRSKVGAGTRVQIPGE